jgi:hypothetical protein
MPSKPQPPSSESAAPTAFVAALATTLEDLHTRIATAMAGIDTHDFDRQLSPSAGSIREVVMAVAAEEYHWIGEIVAELPAAPPAATGAEAPHPLFELGSSGQFSQAILASLPASGWDKVYSVGDRQWTALACVLHVIGELGRALGNIEMMAELARR